MNEPLRFRATEINGVVHVEVLRGEVLVAKIYPDKTGRHLRVASEFLKRREQVSVKRLGPGVIDLLELE